MFSDERGHMGKPSTEFDGVEVIKLQVKNNDLRTENEKLKAELENIKRHTWCAYCREGFPMDTVKAEQIGEHIRTCEKHPMRALEAEFARLKAPPTDEDRKKMLNWLNEIAQNLGEGNECGYDYVTADPESADIISKIRVLIMAPRPRVTITKDEVEDLFCWIHGCMDDREAFDYFKKKMYEKGIEVEEEKP